MTSARGTVRLFGEAGTVEAEALFDDKIPRSLISMDISHRLGSYIDLEGHRFSFTMAGRTIRVIAWANANVEFDGHRIPSTAFDVSPDLPSNTIIVGLPTICTWNADPRVGRARVGEAGIDLTI